MRALRAFGALTSSLALLLAGANALAQNATTVQQGTDFAKGLAPKAAGQVVNPAGVSTPSWGTFVTTPSAVPTNLGGFSSPTTGSDNFNSAKASGLAAFGSTAIATCANFVPGSNADPYQTQACAAVNFLNNACLTPSTEQAAVMTKLGQSQVAGTNCADTYGNAVRLYNFQDQVSSSDSMFGVVAGVRTNAAAQVSTTCTTQNVVTDPAQYETNTCTKNIDTNAESCSQYLNVTISTTSTGATPAYSCTSGVLVGTSCQATTTGEAAQNYVCPAGYDLQGSSCTEVTSTPASPNYSCPAGSTLSGSDCISANQTVTPATVASYSCPVGQTLSGTNCLGTSTIAATLATYSCPAGQTLVGTTCQITTDTVTGSATGTYSCTAGQTLIGTQCISTATTQPINPVNWWCAGTVIDAVAGTCQPAAGRPFQAVNAAGCMTAADIVPGGFGFGVGQFLGYAEGGCSFKFYGNYCPNVSNSHFVLQHVSAVLNATFSTVNSATCIYVTPDVYTCPAGSTLDANNNCIGSTTTTAVVSNYSCPNGGAYANGSCTVTNSSAANVSYSCPAGQLVVGSNCTQTITTSTSATPGYSCPAGYTLSGSSCTGQVTTVATPVYSCPAGQTLSGSSCIGADNVNTPATLVSYSCPAGQTLSGTSCSSTITVAATVSYSCPVGATLSGTECITTTTSPATVDYSCVDGSAPVNGVCFIHTAKSSWTDTCGAFEASAGSMLANP